MGYKILEAPGWEADDILGTLAGACGEGDFATLQRETEIPFSL